MVIIEFPISSPIKAVYIIIISGVCLTVHNCLCEMCLDSIVVFIRLRLINNHRNIHLYLSLVGLALAVMCYQVAEASKTAIVVPTPRVPYIFKEEFWCSDLLANVSCTRVYNIDSVK